jgi:hypothetical protein
MEDGPFRVNTICISRWAWKRKEKKTEGWPFSGLLESEIHPSSGGGGGGGKVEEVIAVKTTRRRDQQVTTVHTVA